MPYDEYQKRSREIARENDTAWDNSPNLENPSLRRIDISENKKSQSKQHIEISADKTYLALIYGQWYVGSFHKEWYGWTYDGWKYNSMQLNNIDVLYEIDLPKMPSRLVPELPSNSYVPDHCSTCYQYDSFKIRKDGSTYCGNCGHELDEE